MPAQNIYPAIAATSPRFWSKSREELFVLLQTSDGGLSTADADSRLEHYGINCIEEKSAASWLRLLRRQLRNPLLAVLVIAASITLLTGEYADGAMVLLILGASVGISFTQEFRAERSLAELGRRLDIQTCAVRDGSDVSIPARTLVPGDIIRLSAGNVVPADALVLSATDFYVNESAVTGELFPARKIPSFSAIDAPPTERGNAVFLGSNVRSGSATCLVVNTGLGTIYGAISERVAAEPPENDFELGLRHFGFMILSCMTVLTLMIFFAHVYRGRPPLDTLLFTLALAVGLSPELLPAILSVNLSRAARVMAVDGILVRRLSAIENLGSMDVLCTDKTGTLTEGIVRVDGAYDSEGVAAQDVLLLASYNSALQTGFASPLDQAIVEAHSPDLTGIRKLGEVPFDFVRKRLSVVIAKEKDTLLITKGAFRSVIECCTTMSDDRPLTGPIRNQLAARYEKWSRAGTRIIAVATRVIKAQDNYSTEDERELSFRGFVAFGDQPKEGAMRAVQELAGLGVEIKMITGDNALVARHVAASIGLPAESVVSGHELMHLTKEAVQRIVERTDIFAEVDPAQKELIVTSLRGSGRVVGFFGDGVNDAPAMRAADTSISIEQAVDVAREAADFVLVRRDLRSIRRGIEEGRITFANTIKYILMTMSANFGNMMSMALASIFLPFLPLLPGQILLTNLLSDIPALGLAQDRVDTFNLTFPHRWNIKFILLFMLVFGAISTLFDMITFGTLLRLVDGNAPLFRTGWFLESLLSELLIIFVIRSRRPFFVTRPSSFLIISSLAVAAIAMILPYTPIATALGFEPPSTTVMAVVITITLGYIAVSEMLKQPFYRVATRM